MFTPHRSSRRATGMAATNNWTVEETNLLIHKRLELFHCARSDKVYDQISVFLAKEHNFYRNAAACQTRFNNLLKTYRVCVKRIETGGFVCKVRFPYFDVFHQYYSKLPRLSETPSGALPGGTGDNATGSKCKSEIFLDELFEDSSFAADGRGSVAGGVTGKVIGSGIDALLMDSMQTDDCAGDESVGEGDEELTTSLTATNGLEDLKLRLMEQKLLYYTNQNMLLQMKQQHYRQKEQDRARNQLMTEEILRVLKGIHNCLKKRSEPKVSKKEPPKVKEVKEMRPPEPQPPPPEVVEPFSPEDVKDHEEQLLEEEEAEEEEEPETGSLQQFAESEEDDDEDVEENGLDIMSSSSTDVGERIIKKQVGRLKVRKNIFPPWNRIQTVLLIKIHCDLRPKFGGYNLFECVSNKLIELHINRTPRDCRTRWNNLFRTYKECRMRLRLNDKASVKFEYFDEIDAYFKDKEFSS